MIKDVNKLCAVEDIRKCNWKLYELVLCKWDDIKVKIVLMMEANFPLCRVSWSTFLCSAISKIREKKFDGRLNWKRNRWRNWCSRRKAIWIKISCKFWRKSIKIYLFLADRINIIGNLSNYIFNFPNFLFPSYRHSNLWMLKFHGFSIFIFTEKKLFKIIFYWL